MRVRESHRESLIYWISLSNVELLYAGLSNWKIIK